MCCDLCCKEFKGWCRSFTRMERALTVLAAVLLVVLVSFLIFLILHLLACSTLNTKYDNSKESDEYEESVNLIVPTTNKHTTTNRLSTTRTPTTSPTPGQTVNPGLECSWTPSDKTTALTHYYETTNIHKKQTKHKKITTTGQQNEKLHIESEHNVDFMDDQSDGEDAEPLHKKHILSLVKLKPPQGVVFGCILTIISEYWMLTAASCIEAIEEMDSLDSFVIIEEYGTSSKGKIRSIFDVQIHPFYRGTNKSYDLAAVRSAASLGAGRAVRLPTVLDNSMITVGERFHLLGFGAYRSIDRGGTGRRLRKVSVFRLAARQCGSAAWAARHLEGGRALPAARGAGALCAGALAARGLPCNYCSGAPLLRAAVAAAVGLMSDNEQCGAACEPQLYVDLAAVRDWIDSVVGVGSAQ